MGKIIIYISEKEVDINEELFKKYFEFKKPSDMLMYLNKKNDEEKNSELETVINSG